jgi:hypothetical protein
LANRNPSPCIQEHQGTVDSKDSLLNYLIIHKVPLIKKTLDLWAAHQLLMKGWELSTPGSLGMFTVNDVSSALYGTIPAPRVLQNQLDKYLEEYCAITEVECLKELQKSMRARQDSRVEIYTVVGLLLHIRERDIWRLSSWIKGRNSVSLRSSQ